MRDVFTVAQVAMALMLLVGAGLLLRSFAKVTAVEPGFRTDRVLTMNLSTPGTRYREGRGERFFAQLRREFGSSAIRCNALLRAIECFQRVTIAHPRSSSVCV